MADYICNDPTAISGTEFVSSTYVYTGRYCDQTIRLTRLCANQSFTGLFVSVVAFPNFTAYTDIQLTEFYRDDDKIIYASDFITHTIQEAYRYTITNRPANTTNIFYPSVDSCNNWTTSINLAGNIYSSIRNISQFDFKIMAIDCNTSSPKTLKLYVYKTNFLSAGGDFLFGSYLHAGGTIIVNCGTPTTLSPNYTSMAGCQIGSPQFCGDSTCNTTVAFSGTPYVL